MNDIMAERYILLVEDNLDEVLLAERALNTCRSSAKLIVAHNGQEALNILFAPGEFASQNQKKIISMVLLDLNLPMISGLEVLRQIRADTSTRELPVIVLTSSMDEKDSQECGYLGASEYIRKPTSYSEFVKIVRDVLLRWMDDDGSQPA
jgi:two-component system response regulator